MAVYYSSRDEAPEEFTWNLEDLFESDEAWFAAFDALRALSREPAAFKGHLADDAETLLSYLRLDDELSRQLDRLMLYASCRHDQDTGCAAYLDMHGRACGLAAELASASAFAAPEIMALEEDRLNLFYIAQPELERYRRCLYRIRRRAAHILTPQEEKLLSAAAEMARSARTVNGVLLNAEMSFPEAEDARGERHRLTGGSFLPLLQSPDRLLRENAFRNYYSRLGEFRNTLAATLDGQFKQLRYFASARGYESALAASLDRTEVPEAVYHNLIDAVHRNLDKLHAYVALRKRLLGVEELHMYDIYAPLVPDAEETIPFERAKEIVLEALAVLGEDYTALLREGFEHRWIDVFENKGKRGGAYSTLQAHPHPYVLLNQKDTLNSLFTLAHEMGHALHSYHSSRAQPTCTERYVIFVAEVASTCNEILLMRHLLARTQDKRRRAWLVNHFLDKFRATVYRQTMFAEFERWMGRRCERGETLTAEALSAEYGRLNEVYYGPDMRSDQEIALEWARIPHFFYNYYVFQYATGFSAAVAIAKRILSEGESAVKDYKRFLSAGGSEDPISLLKIAGVDMSTPAPIDSALSLFGELIGELDALMS